MLIFFFASAAASSAYLTASEVFPLETRALAIATFYAVGTAIGGTIAPALFGHLIETSSGACRRVHIRRLADACCCRCGGRIRHRASTASRSFARSSASVSGLPPALLAKPHCGLMASRSGANALSLRDEAQRCKVAGSRRVIFEQEMICVRAREKTLRNPVVSAIGEVTPPEVAAAHVDADDDLAGTASERAIDRIGVALDQRIGVAARGRNPIADRRIAQQCTSDLVDLQVPTARRDQFRANR